MHYQKLTIATLVAAACANPVNVVKRKTYKEDGNLSLEFSKKTVNIGQIELDKIFEGLDEACGELTCQTNDLEFKGQIVDSESANNIKLTLGPDGVYNADLRDKLFDAWKAAVKEIADCKETTHKSPCPNPMAYCPNKSKKVTQCEVPEYWSVSYGGKKKDTDEAPSNMKADLEVEAVDNPICEKTLESLGAVAGAVNGVAGGFFTLLGFTCK